MRLAKKALSFFLVFALAFGAIAVYANAEYSGVGVEGSILSYTVTADKTTAKPGDTITISVYITTNYYAGGAGRSCFMYNTNFIENVGDTYGTGQYAQMVTDGFLVPGPYLENFSCQATPTSPAAAYPTAYTGDKTVNKLFIVYNTYTPAISQTGVIANNILMYSVKMKVKSTATAGTATFWFDPTCVATQANKGQAGNIFQTIASVEGVMSSQPAANKFAETVNLNNATVSVNIVVPQNVDFTALAAALAKVSDVGAQSTYTAASWSTYATALAEAQALDLAYDFDNPPVDEDGLQDEVDAAATALESAITGLTALGSCDYAALDTAIATTPAYAEEMYTATTWSAYETALQAANAVTRNMTADEAGANQLIINNAATALNNARTGLQLKPADFTALDAAIDAATATDSSLYASSTWTEYASAKAAATGYDRTGKTVLDNEEIAALATALEDATANLEPLPECDYTELDTEIETLPAYAQEMYTPVSWNAYRNSLQDAQAVTPGMIDDEAGTNQALIDAAAADLNAKRAALKLKGADFTALDAAITAATATDSSLYTTDSWNTYASAKAAAQSYNRIDKTILDQTAITALATALSDATAALAPRSACDYSALDSAIADVPDFAEEYYTAVSWGAYSTALATANGVQRNMIDDEDGVNRAIIASAALNLTDAKEALQFRPADFTSLDAAIAAATATDSSLYTASSWATYANAKAAATGYNRNGKNILNQSQIEALALALNTAVTGLRSLTECDYSALETAIAAIPGFAQELYTTSSWAAYANALSTANGVTPNMTNDEDGINQRIIDDAAAALNSARLALQFKSADFTALDAAITGATATDDTLYTSASWSAYASAKAAATGYDRTGKDIRDNAAIAGLATALSDATAGLTFKPADFTALDAAIAGATVTDDTLYTSASWSAYASAKAAATGYDRTGKDIRDNAAIAGLATALSDATAGLAFKPADFTALDAAIAGATATDATLYTTATWAPYASAKAAATGYDRTGKDIRDNAAIAALATALSDATAALAALPLCDYERLDAALALVPALDGSSYTNETWAAYQTALSAGNSIAKGLPNDENGVNAAAILNAAIAIENAYAALEEKSHVFNYITAVNQPANYIRNTLADFDFVCAQRVEKIRVTSPDGYTKTYKRDHDLVEITAGENGTETWTIGIMFTDSGTYNATAKITQWDEADFLFTVNAGTGIDNEVKSAAISSESFFVNESQTITVVTGNSVRRIRLVFANGTTSTYSAYTVNNDGNRVFTITRTFAKADYDVAIDTFASGAGWVRSDKNLVFSVSRDTSNDVTTETAITEFAATTSTRIIRGNTVTFKVVTKSTCNAIRIRDSKGTTAVYKTGYVDDNGVRTWTVERQFTALGNYKVYAGAYYVSKWYTSATAIDVVSLY